MTLPVIHQSYYRNVGIRYNTIKNKEVIINRPQKISIITPSFNQGKYIEECIKSVLHQNYPNVEHIVIDGGSSDNTIDILKKYPHLKWTSEPDEGQADALNKGLKMSSGDVIGWINSDDYYMPNVFGDVVNAFINKKTKWIVSNQYFLRAGRISKVQVKDFDYKKLLNNPDLVKQQGAFYLKTFLEDVGGFDKRFYMVMDFDLWVKLAKVDSPIKIEIFTSCFREHETQKTTLCNIMLQLKELKFIMRKEGACCISIISLSIRKYKTYLKNKIKICLVEIGLLDKSFLRRPVKDSIKI